VLNKLKKRGYEAKNSREMWRDKKGQDAFNFLAKLSQICNRKKYASKGLALLTLACVLAFFFIYGMVDHIPPPIGCAGLNQSVD